MKYIRLSTICILFVILAIPSASAQTEYRPGTDLYLRNEIGLNDQQLQTKYKTEEREAFSMINGELEAYDPVADVLDRYGTRSSIQAGWADLERVRIEKDTTDGSWIFIIEPAESLPEDPGQKVQFWILTDSDGNGENNAQKGIRIDADQSHMAKYDVENGWATDYRWFNHETDFWAMNKKTEATFDITSDGKLVYAIPFSEIPAEFEPKWRVVTAVEDGGDTQIDTIPGEGFPPPKEGYSNNQPANGEKNDEGSVWFSDVKLKTGHYVMGVAIFFSILYLALVLKRE